MKKLFPTLVLAIILFSCDNGGMETQTNPFLGAWETSGAGGFYFTETECQPYVYNSPEDKINRIASIDYSEGIPTYTYDDTTLTITWPEESHFGEKTRVIPYDFSNGYEFVIGNGEPYKKVTPPTLLTS
jgi:hypothetical protein